MPFSAPRFPAFPCFLASLVLLPMGLRAESARGGRALAEVGASREFIRFAAVGSPSGAEGTPRKMGERVRSWAPEFVIAPGAAGYPDGGAELLCPPLKDDHYEVARGPVHLFFLAADSAAQDAARDGARARWLRKALAASPAAWKIVYLLHAPYSSASAADPRAPRWPFKDWGADAVLSGREGGYERLRIDGLTFIVNGPSVAGTASLAAGSRLPGSQCLFDEDAGALLIEADGSRIDFRFVTAEGTVVDATTLRKPALAGNPSPAATVSAPRR